MTLPWPGPQAADLDVARARLDPGAQVAEVRGAGDVGADRSSPG